MTVHGDDFTATGSQNSLIWLENVMKAAYDIKSTLLGPEEGMQQSIRILNRTLRWEQEGIVYEPDEKHAGVIIQTMGVENGKSVATPALTERAEDVQDREGSEELSPTETTSYRALAARVSYLSADRPDIQFTSKSLCKFMSKPRQFDWVGMKRLARYLLRAKRSRQTFAWQPKLTEVTTFTDSDWGGDRRTRKSTSGGIMQLGKHVVKSWSTSQTKHSVIVWRGRTVCSYQGRVRDEGAGVIDD